MLCTENIFGEFYDFADAGRYGLSRGASGVIFNSLKPNITLPNKDLSDIRNYYIHTEKYSPKSYVVNFRTQISSSQSEERTIFFHG